MSYLYFFAEISSRNTLNEQTTCPPPEVVGIYFATDVLKRNKQLILVLRKTVSSYTIACIIENEKHDTLRVSLLKLILGLHPLDGPSAIIRCDAAPGFVALREDEKLKSLGIVLEIGCAKNVNKNPVAERANLEFEKNYFVMIPLVVQFRNKDCQLLLQD
jgi:hypothetical protein